MQLWESPQVNAASDSVTAWPLLPRSPRVCLTSFSPALPSCSPSLKRIRGSVVRLLVGPGTAMLAIISSDLLHRACKMSKGRAKHEEQIVRRRALFLEVDRHSMLLQVFPIGSRRVGYSICVQNLCPRRAYVDVFRQHLI
jgi:hypothetical protein